MKYRFYGIHVKIAMEGLSSPTTRQITIGEYIARNELLSSLAHYNVRKEIVICQQGVIQLMQPRA